MVLLFLLLLFSNNLVYLHKHLEKKLLFEQMLTILKKSIPFRMYHLIYQTLIFII